MAKKVHMIKREIKAGESIFFPRAHAEGICGVTTRSMKNATYNWKEVTCNYCIGRRDGATRDALKDGVNGGC